MWSVVLEVSSGAASDEAIANAICAVKEQLRSVPEHVQQYGMPFRDGVEHVGLGELVFRRAQAGDKLLGGHALSCFCALSKAAFCSGEASV